jgi:hypothetical protein
LLLSLAAFFGARHNATASRPDAAAKTYVVPAEPKREAKKEVSVAPPRAETVIRVQVPHKKATVPAAPAPMPRRKRSTSPEMQNSPKSSGTIAK